MKDEIEKVLYDASTGYEGGVDFDEEKAVAGLQKLFLSKQLIMVEDLMNGGALMSSLKAKREQLQSELKGLG